MRSSVYFPTWIEHSRKRQFARYTALRAAIVFCIMIDTFRRMFQGTRPIDYVMLVVEVLVLLIIAVEAIAHAIRGFRVKRRTKRLLVLVESGQALQRRGPALIRGQEKETYDKWIAEVVRWMADTSILLEKYSSQAVAAFDHDEEGLSFTFRPIAEDGRATYEHLKERLNNLRDIIEKADVYL
jgi:hypothetical protein